ncbi:amidohydrolase family protein [Streptomyces sp. NPDC087420]|uniref:amidohydrolase family protein n=1 Tax=Streptomyces sp. NPDC087420 TaxID=3365785 RepID=UPI0038380E3B
MTTRRRTLIGMGALAANALSLGQAPQARATEGAESGPANDESRTATADFPLARAIDVHAHYITPTYRQALIDAGLDQPDGMSAIPAWSVDGALELMDSTGIAAALLSVSSPGFAVGDHHTARALVRQVNEEGAALVKANPTRFGLLASLPLPDADAAVEEVAHVFDVLKADGISLETNYEGTYLGDPSFRPVLAELNERQAVVHLHPTSPACWEATALGRARPMIEFLFDTTRTVTQLILDRVVENYPDIRFIVPHAGAALPVLADRIAAFALTESTPPVDVIGALKRLHYDVAGFALPRALPALLHLVDTERLLYGSDYPFTAEAAVKALGVRLAATDVLTAQQRQRVLSGNAARLFPRLADGGNS